MRQNCDLKWSNVRRLLRTVSIDNKTASNASLLACSITYGTYSTAFIVGVINKSRTFVSIVLTCGIGDDQPSRKEAVPSSTCTRCETQNQKRTNRKKSHTNQIQYLFTYIEGYNEHKPHHNNSITPTTTTRRRNKPTAA